VDDEKDLGITVTNNMKREVLDQCTKAAAKAMQVLGVIKRNFVLADWSMDVDRLTSTNITSYK